MKKKFKKSVVLACMLISRREFFRVQKFEIR